MVRTLANTHGDLKQAGNRVTNRTARMPRKTPNAARRILSGKETPEMSQPRLKIERQRVRRRNMITGKCHTTVVPKVRRRAESARSKLDRPRWHRLAVHHEDEWQAALSKIATIIGERLSKATAS